ncbi:hypothetical protein RHMOL_Rhmol13G0017800 [Rhododendron molle]|uniref:Uncharacterized protein n=1 Tax=Rhododendron molle TaxID=49168 RepID=A0ACC0L2U5_RHOML|nr:hypothetical protein RHMOL_Rhmol13G0017800 [Rhododendron molle]
MKRNFIYQYAKEQELVRGTEGCHLVNFQKGGGSGQSECDNKCHSDSTPIVALTTGWYNGGSRCLKEMAVAHQNATRSTTRTAHRLWHYRPGGTTEGAGVSKTSPSMLTGGVSNAVVVDERDSTMRCYDDHDYQPLCPNDIDATKAMWEVLGVPRDSCSELDITWTDA